MQFYLSINLPKAVCLPEIKSILLAISRKRNDSKWELMKTFPDVASHLPKPQTITKRYKSKIRNRFNLSVFNTFKSRVSTASQAQRRCSLGILLLTFMTFNTISKDNLSFLIIKNCMLCAALEVTDWLSTHSKQWLILLMVKWDFNCFRPLNDSSHDLN